MEFTVRGARILGPEGIQPGDLHVAGAHLTDAGTGGMTFEGRGLLALPGIVDLHGDAFERQVMPRPGVMFPIDMALLETDRQLVCNGITTAFHGLTWSWEPGLRSGDAAQGFIDAMELLRPRLACDTRVHLRHETYNVGGETRILEWLAAGKLGLLAFNNHLPMMQRKRGTNALTQYADRAGLSVAQFNVLVDEVATREGQVSEVNARLAKAAQARAIPLASHDDDTAEIRVAYHDLGCRLAEFPTTRVAAESARAMGDAMIFGAPNVVRGGSHTGGLSVADLVREGLADVLTSDYYYPALLHAPFRLVQAGLATLAEAWKLVSTNPAHHAGLTDRGELVPGKRADFLLLDDSDPALPRLIATVAGGQIAYAASGVLA